MSDWTHNLGACHRCPLRRSGFCSVDERSIVDHAKSGYCPDPDGPRFGDGAVVELPDPPAQPAPPSPVPYELWPWWAKLLSLRAIETDAGVGDVAQRYAAQVGGERFKRLYKRASGQGCGCEVRQAEWNAKYPLSEMDDGLTRQSCVERHSTRL